MKQFRGIFKRVKKTIGLLGPGLITGASDDDPSGIATYSQAGAQFGFGTLWTALLTYPLMAGLQGMCARIGMVTKHGLTVTVKNHYPRWMLYVMLLIIFPAITLNIGADIQGMGAVANMMFPLIPVPVYCIAITFILMFMIIRFPYTRIAGILKWLCLSLLLYLIVPFVVGQDWLLVLRHLFVPDFSFDKNFLTILVAILGTTISPYLFFWQATMESEDIAHRKTKVVVNKRILGEMKTDVNLGMLFSNMVMFFIILTTGSVLYNAGIRNIVTVEQAARALEPLAGKFAYAIFTLGIIGSGCIAIPVLAGSQSYMLAETFGWKEGLDKPFPKAKGFYISITISLIVGLTLDFMKINPVKALVYTAILYGITAPAMIAVILHIANNKKIMKTRTNNKFSNFLGFSAFILMSIAAIAMIWLTISA